MKKNLATFICFNLFLFSALEARYYREGCYISCEFEDSYKTGLEFAYTNIINTLNENINTTSEKIELLKDSSNQYWLEKRDFYIECKQFYIDCKQIIESKYPIQTKEREDTLKFIETTRMW